MQRPIVFGSNRSTPLEPSALPASRLGLDEPPSASADRRTRERAGP